VAINNQKCSIKYQKWNFTSGRRRLHETTLDQIVNFKSACAGGFIRRERFNTNHEQLTSELVTGPISLKSDGNGPFYSTHLNFQHGGGGHLESGWSLPILHFFYFGIGSHEPICKISLKSDEN
jgi:hypothetical protein